MVRAYVLALLSLAGSGCALTQSTADVVIDYNRSFAQSRNEMLLLNVLRAAAREPMQFSTMGQVQGQVGNTAQLTLPFTNVIAGGKDIISPSLVIGDAVNPNVSIIPLTHKEFATGILSPLKLETIQLLLHNGWDAHFLLPLVVGGVICPGKQGQDRRELLLNSGEYLADDSGAMKPTALHLAFRQFFFRSAAKFRVSAKPDAETAQRTLLLADKDALSALKDGIGTKYAVGDISDAEPGQKQLTINPAKIPAVEGLDFGPLCNRPQDLASAAQPRVFLSEEQAEAVLGTAEQRESKSKPADGSIVFRSVGSIIQYLGESHRVRYNEKSKDEFGLIYLNAANTPKILFKIDWSPSAGHHAVETRFQDETFFIPRLELRRGDDHDRTLKTLSFIDQLIALQTSESAIRGAQAVIALPQ